MRKSPISRLASAMSTFTRRQTRAAKSALSWRSSLIDGVPRLAMAAGPAKDASAENATPPCGNRFSRYPLPRVGLGSERLAKRCREMPPRYPAGAGPRPRSLGEACRKAERDEDGERCPDCALKQLCENET